LPTGGISRWKFGFGNFAAGPLSASVTTKYVRAEWSLVEVPKPQDGALRALETTCFPRELSSGDGSSNGNVLALRGVEALDVLPPKLHEGADFRAEVGWLPPMLDGKV